MNRLTNFGKPEEKLSSRVGSDINKIKVDFKKPKKSKQQPPSRMKRVVNNVFIPPRMLPSKTDRIKFRQEIPQDIGVRPLPKDKQPIEKDELNENIFVRVGNNLIRGEQSVLDQAERLIHSRIIRREVSQELDKTNQREFKKQSEILKAGHVAEKDAIADNEKRFLSKFTGPVKTLVEVPEIKQELTVKQAIKRRIRLGKRSRRKTRLDKLTKKFEVGKLKNLELRQGFRKFIKEHLKEGFAVDPREEAGIRLQQKAGIRLQQEQEGSSLEGFKVGERTRTGIIF